MKIIPAFLLVSLLGFPFSAIAQKHDHIWLFGRSNQEPPHSDARMDFNFDPPLITHDPRPMTFYHNCAVTADFDGNLLFYSNGKSVANKDHQTMQNGSGLNPGDQGSIEGYNWVNAPQCIVSLPAPGESNKYYLVHAPWKIFVLPDSAEINSFALLYTAIDMGGNNGLGSVTAKNQIVVPDTLWPGKLTAAQHANGRDWWILYNKKVSNQYYNVLVSPQGIEVVDTQYVGTPSVDSGLGQAVFSPDGSKFIVVDAAGDTNIQIYDFDRCNGKLSNEIKIKFIHWIASPGIAISPNSRFLYLSATDTLYQFDLWSDSIHSSQIIVGVYDGHVDPFSSTFYLAQLAPDGKIYICVPNGSNYLHVIEKPNEKGLACDFRQHAINLMNRNGFSLPNNPNYRLGPLDGSPCDTLGLDNVPVAKFRYAQDTTDHLQITFTDLSYYEPTEWLWDFGDGATSQDTSPVHLYQDGGLYDVCLTVANANGSSTYCRSLELATVSAAGPLPTMDVAVFPNPCREGTNVVLQDYLPRRASIVLYDATGRIALRQRVFAGMNPIGLSQVPPGLYFYEIREQGRLLGGGKLVRVNH